MPANFRSGIHRALASLAVAGFLASGTPIAQAGDAPGGRRPAAEPAVDLQSLSEQLDRLDKLDLEEALEKADACLRSDDFSCVERQLKRARQSANSSSDRKRIQGVQTALADRRELLAQEKRRREEEEARRAEEERAAEWARINTPTVTVYEGSPGPSTDFAHSGRQLIDLHNRFVASLPSAGSRPTPSSTPRMPEPYRPPSRADSRAPEPVAGRPEPSRSGGAPASEPRSGTVYFMVQARVRSNLVSRGSRTPDAHLDEDDVVPVEWTWSKPGPVFMEEVVRAARRDVLERFRAHVEREYRRCPGDAKGECWAIDLYADHGTTADEARSRHDQTARQVGAVRDKRDAAFSYRTSVTIR